VSITNFPIRDEVTHHATPISQLTTQKDLSYHYVGLGLLRISPRPKQATTDRDKNVSLYNCAEGPLKVGFRTLGDRMASSKRPTILIEVHLRPNPEYTVPAVLCIFSCLPL
jgi:hypothetical protein